MTEHDHEYLSECCEAFPVRGELDLTPADGVMGICLQCRDPVPFVCIECEEETNTAH